MIKRKKPYTQLRLPSLCKQCQQPIFHPARADKLYCSGKCRVAFWRIKKNAS